VKIAVLGDGNGSFAAAGDFALAGHQVRMRRRAGEAVAAHRQAGGAIMLKDYRGRHDVALALVTSDIAAAVAEAELILCPTPVEHPERFLNAHWLNPPYLMPLVELSAGRRTGPEATQSLRQLLEGIGKITVLCAARPGYIVPRIQALAMNEAARMVEEGMASAEEIDKAAKYGFGLRFAVLGLLEFIDWGGGDILYYASRYLTEALGNERYAAPEIIARNMREGRIGMKTGRGFLDYDKIDLEGHRMDRLDAFANLLRGFGLARPPVL
jgi:3-hydroxyacyl-CoA dehydrogenase